MVDIKHIIDTRRKEKFEAENPTFTLSNNKGDYIWMGSGPPKSRYEGWFCSFDPQETFRIIDFMEVKGGGAVSEISNRFTHFERKRENVSETFYLVPSSHVLVYELDKKKEVEIFFDARHSYDPARGADYRLEKEGEVTVIEFENGIFLAIKGGEVQDIKEPVNRYYSYDEGRNSPPFSREVFRGVNVLGKRLVLSASKNRREAIEGASKMFIRSVLTEKEDSVDIQCAKKALSNLFVSDYPGLYAGLPWFFQFWSRDESISLKALFEIDKEKGKRLFFRLLEDGLRRGPREVINMDAPGWIFKRAEDILPFADKKEKELINRSLKRHIEELLWTFTSEGFATNRPKETWMDSIDRNGARIEIQAMRLNMYRLASLLAKKRKMKVFYKKMEKDLRKKVRGVFFDGENLYDGYYPYVGITEKVIRPNIFIAAYIYPQLLSRREWIKCFDNALSSLWLPWGGVATLDKEDDNFHYFHTGEDSRSYHQGDSWFYLNNLTALVLWRTDRKRYEYYIRKILEASREELLTMGAIGTHAEVSSAKELESGGCVNQAWSNAMYLEAKKEIEG